MGLLSEGSPLSWEETRKYAEHVRKLGIDQFIKLFHKLKNRKGDELKWGDEVEYMLVEINNESKTAKLRLNAGEILDILQEKEKNFPNDHPTTWRPEYASYMIEGTPGKPYGHLMAHFNVVEANMKLRREEVKKLLQPNEHPLSLTVFPRMGSPNFTSPITVPTPTSGASHSLYFSDDVIFGQHPRFKTLTRNVRERRGEKPHINVPIYKDKNTPETTSDDPGAKPGHIYMDCMGFGMGCSCLQMTFQACCIDEARLLYDELSPLCPIILALSAATPYFRGFLADVDCRWDIISGSVDDRTREERGLEPLKEDKFVIPKSRYGTADSYLHHKHAKYNDIELLYDKKVYDKLRENDIDDLLAQHIAHLFIRDTISLFSEKINPQSEDDTDHFENIQSTNWQSMRFKPPPPQSSIGWRVEFRPTEVQLTDFENAAFATFIVMLTRAIMSYKLHFVLPISKVHENMQKAQKRDAVLNEKFWFRRCVTECEGSDCCETGLFTIDEIINGCSTFPGLVPLVKHYITSIDDCDVDTQCTVLQYLKLIEGRANGKLWTAARWLRNLVTSHPEYKNDSVISEEISHHVMQQAELVTEGKLVPPELIINFSTKTAGDINAATEKHHSLLASKREQVTPSRN